MLPNSIAGRVAELRPTAVNRVLAEVRQLQAEGKTLISLMRGQPDTPTPAPIVEAATRALRAGRTGYADMQGEPDLRRAVAEKLLRDDGLSYDPDREILITDGATCGIATALGTLLEPGDEILLPDPIYDAYASPIALWGGRAVSVASTVRGGRFCLEPAALEAACTPRTRLLLLNDPWNPVGTVLTGAELEAIMSVAESRNLFVVSDAIYEALVYDGRRHLSPASLSASARQRTLVVNSLSKTYAMTGWRVGYCAGPPEVIAAMLLVLQQSSRGPATFVQDAAACALRLDTKIVHDMTAEFQKRRDQVLTRLREVPGVEALTCEGGLFVMADVRRLDPSSDAVRRWLLREAGVVVIHGAAYGAGGEGTLRISFAAGGDTLTKGLDRLCQGLWLLGERTS